MRVAVFGGFGVPVEGGFGVGGGAGAGFVALGQPELGVGQSGLCGLPDEGEAFGDVLPDHISFDSKDEALAAPPGHSMASGG